MFDANGVPDSLISAGVRFGSFLFITLVAYFVISYPVNIIFDGFESANWANAESQKTIYMPIIRQCMSIFFAILVSLPMTWFIFWVFHREPRYQNVDYRQWR